MRIFKSGSFSFVVDCKNTANDINEINESNRMDILNLLTEVALYGVGTSVFNSEKFPVPYLLFFLVVPKKV